MKVYDCFSFNDELDLLELRLETLDTVVDVFVLVELPINYRQVPKPLHFSENKKRFAKWADKIRVVVPTENLPNQAHPAIEHHQRRSFALGFSDAQPEDFLLVGDADEIPDPEAVRRIIARKPDHPTTLVMPVYYYHVNRLVHQEWTGTVVVPRGVKLDIDCEHIRQHRFFFPKERDAGWHFSWLGTPEQLAAKVRAIDVQRDAIMYQSPNIVCPDPDDLAYLEKCRETGADLFGRPEVHALVPIEPGVWQPEGIEAWLAKYPQYAVQGVVA